MASEHDRATNQAAYERLKGTINEKYPEGRFVALARGEIVADTESFEKMLESLPRLGWNPRDAMVIKVGYEPHGNIWFPRSVNRG